MIAPHVDVLKISKFGIVIITYQLYFIFLLLLIIFTIGRNYRIWSTVGSVAILLA